MIALLCLATSSTSKNEPRKACPRDDGFGPLRSLPVHLGLEFHIDITPSALELRESA